ncbi:MAG: hypothetical protein HN350_16635 [Phycisphaerales bacterium]|jgi:hypothetical protein|nr:hypothetical protein [Phycisphaerales bacterium]
MNIKQTENYRRQQASLDAVDRPNQADRPEQHAFCADSGVAKIVTNAENGAYTITQQWWDSGADPPAWSDAISPGGLVGASARDIDQRDGAEAGRIVRFWRERDLSGAIETLIDIGWVSPAFWASITGSAADGANRWKYAFSEVYKSSAGYGGWATLSGGRSGTTSTNPARNSIEDMNTGADSHVEGNGVDPANLDPAATGSDTFSLMPCTSGNIVQMRQVDCGSAVEYWFSYENGVDGDCGS